MSKINREVTITLAGGRITCARCQAMSKRSREQCKKAALKDKAVCGFHGGKSTGPKTPRGRLRISKANLIHGQETRINRLRRSESSAYMLELEDVAWALEMMTGDRTRGRKANGYTPIKTLEQATTWILKHIKELP